MDISDVSAVVAMATIFSNDDFPWRSGYGLWYVIPRGAKKSIELAEAAMLRRHSWRQAYQIACTFEEWPRIDLANSNDMMLLAVKDNKGCEELNDCFRQATDIIF
jgi:hypothetical protein